MTRRRIDFEGCFNFRDLGGWQTADGRTVRWRRVYRADSVHLMTEGDARRAQDELGLRLLVDLRGPMEIQFAGVGLLAEAGTARVHLPISEHRQSPTAIDTPVAAARTGLASGDRSPDTMVASYTTMLERCPDLITDAVRALADGDKLPAVFFCSAGKDRTGVLSAVVLGALGVRDEDVVTDYVLTGETIDKIIGRFAVTAPAGSVYTDNPPSYFAPYAETMQRVLTYVRDHHGSFAGYLRDHGVSDTELKALSVTLLD